jgi:4-hydroxy-tetrahydrodipicolinate synthase
MRTPFTGAGTALITPFTSSGALDEAGVRRLARRQIDGGIHFLVPCGTTGETPTLSLAEKRRIVEICVEESNGAVPVLAGAGGYDTKEIIHTAQEWEKVGANGILSVTPYYNKPTPEGLYQHYKAIAESTALPIILYNVPGRTGCNIDPSTLLRLTTIPGVIGVKEATANISQMLEICQVVPDDFLVLCGDDACTVPLMSIGGRGLVSVASNEAPTEIAQLVEACERGDYVTARHIHRKMMPLMTVNFVESSPGPVKFAMSAMGLCENVFRLPMVPPRAASQEKVLAVLRELGMPIVTGSHA